MLLWDMVCCAAGSELDQQLSHYFHNKNFNNTEP